MGVIRPGGFVLINITAFDGLCQKQFKIEAVTVPYDNIKFSAYPSVSDLCQFNYLWHDKEYIDECRPVTLSIVITFDRNGRVEQCEDLDEVTGCQRYPKNYGSKTFNESDSSEFELLDKSVSPSTAIDAFYDEKDECTFEVDLPDGYLMVTDFLYGLRTLSEFHCVTFLHRTGSVQCSKMVLMLSSFFSDQIANHDQNGSAYIMDYRAYPAQVILTFIDYLHSMPVDPVELPTMLSLVYFLCSEGKHKSYFERVLCKSLLDEFCESEWAVIKSDKLSCQFLICEILKRIPNCDCKFERIIGKQMVERSRDDFDYNFDQYDHYCQLDKSPYKELISMLFAFEDEEDVSVLVSNLYLSVYERMQAAYSS